MKPPLKPLHSWKYFFQFSGLMAPPTWLFITLVTWLDPFDVKPETSLMAAAAQSAIMTFLCFCSSILMKFLFKTNSFALVYLIVSCNIGIPRSFNSGWSGFFISLSYQIVAIGFEGSLIVLVLRFLNRRKLNELSSPMADPELDARMT
jgi:hypothetical protein